MQKFKVYLGKHKTIYVVTGNEQMIPALVEHLTEDFGVVDRIEPDMLTEKDIAEIQESIDYTGSPMADYVWNDEAGGWY